MEHNVVNALIEIPLGSKNKYELDPKTGRIQLDRVLYASDSEVTFDQLFEKDDIVYRKGEGSPVESTG